MERNSAIDQALMANELYKALTVRQQRDYDDLKTWIGMTATRGAAWQGQQPDRNIGYDGPARPRIKEDDTYGYD